MPTWATLLLYLFRQLSRKWGVFGAASLFLVKNDILALVGDDLVPNVSTPDELKAKIIDYITEKIQKAIPNPIVGRIVARVVSAITDDLIDSLWNWLHGMGAVAKSVTHFRPEATAAFASAEMVAQDDLWSACIDGMVA